MVIGNGVDKAGGAIQGGGGRMSSLQSLFPRLGTVL